MDCVVQSSGRKDASNARDGANEVYIRAFNTKDGFFNIILVEMHGVEGTLKCISCLYCNLYVHTVCHLIDIDILDYYEATESLIVKNI